MNTDSPSSTPTRPPVRFRVSIRLALLLLTLLTHGAEVNLADKQGNRPLHNACKHVAYPRANLAVVGELLPVGADVNARNKHGETPLHLIVNALEPRDSPDKTLYQLLPKRDFPIVQSLLDAGADPTLRDHAGRQALERMTPSRGRELGILAVARARVQNSTVTAWIEDNPGGVVARFQMEGDNRGGFARRYDFGTWDDGKRKRRSSKRQARIPRAARAHAAVELNVEARQVRYRVGDVIFQVDDFMGGGGRLLAPEPAQ